MTIANTPVDAPKTKPTTKRNDPGYVGRIHPEKPHVVLYGETASLLPEIEKAIDAGFAVTVCMPVQKDKTLANKIWECGVRLLYVKPRFPEDGVEEARELAREIARRDARY